MIWLKRLYKTPSLLRSLLLSRLAYAQEEAGADQDDGEGGLVSGQEVLQKKQKADQDEDKQTEDVDPLLLEPHTGANTLANKC